MKMGGKRGQSNENAEIAKTKEERKGKVEIFRENERRRES